MSQDDNIVSLHKMRLQKVNKLTDHERVVIAYHYFESNNVPSAKEILGEVSQAYWQTQFHKDLSRALLCQTTARTNNDPVLGKESEFYLVVYRLTKLIVTSKTHFTGSGHFYQLKDELFKGFTSEWR